MKLARVGSIRANPNGEQKAAIVFGQRVDTRGTAARACSGRTLSFFSFGLREERLLRKRRGVHNGVTGMELMNMNVDQGRCLLKPSALLQLDRDQ